MQPNYILERWPHGWLVSPPENQSGIPIQAFAEIETLLNKGKKMVVDGNIGHHYITQGKNVTLCIGNPDELKLWEDEINKSIQHKPPATRWWQGLDVGSSSATIFGKLVSKDCPQKDAATRFGKGSYPKDCQELERCFRLLKIFPEWKKELHQVAKAFPQSPWPQIIENWEALENASTNAERNKILQEIIYPNERKN